MASATDSQIEETSSVSVVQDAKRNKAATSSVIHLVVVVVMMVMVHLGRLGLVHVVSLTVGVSMCWSLCGFLVLKGSAMGQKSNVDQTTSLVSAQNTDSQKATTSVAASRSIVVVVMVVNLGWLGLVDVVGLSVSMGMSMARLLN